METGYILSLSDPRATLALAGGKGANLARLAQAGLPVPGGFHVTTTAYLDFVAENHLQERILALTSMAALAPVDPDRYDTLEAASQAIRDLFQQAVIPVAIETAITLAYADLPGERPLVAVRSSATAEDLPGLSFAGQQETYLNIRGAASVLESVKSCWASLWTARAIGYRAQHAIAPEDISLAVVVQALVCAEASGVMFTANPANGRRDQVIITAAWGLGEAIVGGLVTPDTLIVNKATGQVIERQTARKEVHTVLLEGGGTREQPTAEDLRDKAVLSDRQAADLAGLGGRIEALYCFAPRQRGRACRRSPAAVRVETTRSERHLRARQHHRAVPRAAHPAFLQPGRPDHRPGNSPGLQRVYGRQEMEGAHV
jgi:pyruvate,water dikinase